MIFGQEKTSPYKMKLYQDFVKNQVVKTGNNLKYDFRTGSQRQREDTTFYRCENTTYDCEVREAEN